MEGTRPCGNSTSNFDLTLTNIEAPDRRQRRTPGLLPDFAANLALHYRLWTGVWYPRKHINHESVWKLGQCLQQDHGARQQPIFQYIRDFDNSTRKLVSLPLGCPGYTYEHILLACHLIAETRPLECVPNQDIFISPMFPSTTCSVAQLLSSIGRLGRTLYGNISHADGSQMASTSSSHLRNEVLVPKGGRSDVA